jgi:uridine monophosphate synthetase
METSDLTTAITEQDRARLADMLFEIGAVKFGAFRIKLHETRPDAPLSPIYLNFRLLRSYPAALGFAAELLLKLAGPLRYELLADIPTGITPIVAVMTYLGKVPMISPRKEAKAYGLGVAIDGEYKEGQRVLLVDDLISAGDSKFEAIEKLQKAGLVVEDVLVVVDRQQGGAAMLTEKGFRPHAVATISQLLERYRATGAIDEARYRQVVEYLGLK